MMNKLVCLSLCVALTGCSVAFGSGGKQRTSMIAADGALSAAAVAVAIADPGSQMSTCDSSQWSCWPHRGPGITGIAVGTAVVFALSAMYGLSQHEAPADTRAHDLSSHAMIAAHAGRCAEASDSATRLRALDRDAYEQLLGDDAIHGCLQ